MKLLVFRALWGMSGAVPDQIEQIAAAGYDGAEFWPDHTGITRAVWMEYSHCYRLKAIVGALVVKKAELEPTLTRLAEFDPFKINLHSGQDSMCRDEASAFFEEALRVEQKIGIPVAHETHRGRILYTPWDTAYYLRQFEALKINADYSHWVNVCERLPDDRADDLDVANRRAIHIHGRVGYEEGPQVPDPSAPEYAIQVDWHETQWKRIREFRRDAGDDVLTFTPEYGPPNYLHTLPHSQEPVADLWQVCLWGAERARQVLG